MSRYPDTPRPISPYPFRNNRPFVAGGPEWAPQSRNLTRFGLAEADLSYRGKSWADIQTLYKFFDSVGPGGRFTFVDFNGIGVVGGTDPGVPWVGLFVAQGDGIATSWDAPTYGIVVSPAPVVYENGSAKTTDWNTTTPAAGHYGLKVGTGTDGVDKIYAGTAPASGVIVTIDATCRRAFRRAKYVAAKSAFVYNVPQNYYADSVTIIEVRK
jgi:hypothetical protein